MRARAIKFALLLVGCAAGAAIEWRFYDGSAGPAAAAADLAVGCALLACGVVAWDRRPESRAGRLMALAGSCWFLGNVGGPLVYLHRGPLVQLHLSYPTGRLRSRVARTVVAAGYVVAAVAPLARQDVLTLVLSGAVALTALHVFLGTSGPARKAGGPALAAAIAFAAVLALGASMRLATGPAHRVAVLWSYDVVIGLVVVLLLIDLLRGRWAEAVVAGLVVDLGRAGGGETLRAKLAHALGDPSLVIAYRLADSNRFVDDAGGTVELPPSGSGRTVTPLVDHGEQTAVLVHDELVTDPYLLESVAAAARVAVANARLQARARAHAVELEASRRRIVEAADGQRRRLGRELRLGAERRLERVASLVADARARAGERDTEAIAALEKEVAQARRELDEFARGVHPRALTEGGLAAGIAQLAAHSPVPVAVRGSVGRLPAPIETALFFVCSEALANVSKHAQASRVAIELRAHRRRVEVVVADDGVGGAEPGRGSGLAGLADRVEALGGTLRVESRAGAGTRVVAQLPLSEPG
jgi:signal transduction histidine kinase